MTPDMSKRREQTAYLAASALLPALNSEEPEPTSHEPAAQADASRMVSRPATEAAVNNAARVRSQHENANAAVIHQRNSWRQACTARASWPPALSAAMHRLIWGQQRQGAASPRTSRGEVK